MRLPGTCSCQCDKVPHAPISALVALTKPQVVRATLVVRASDALRARQNNRGRAGRAAYMIGASFEVLMATTRSAQMAELDHRPTPADNCQLTSTWPPEGSPRARRAPDTPAPAHAP
jgi:hypothetical protein